MDAEELVPLSAAVGLYRSEFGGNSYSWYQSAARQFGSVAFCNLTIPAVKMSGRWQVAVSDVNRALDACRARRAEVAQRTAEYKAGIIHVEGAVIDWGSYTVRGAFHRLTILRPLEPSESSWRCNSCLELAQTERGGEECHRCRDWGSCGNDCTLTRVSCQACGTSLDLGQSGN